MTLLMGLGMGTLIALAGIVIIWLARDMAERLRDASKITLTPEGIINPVSVGCGGIAIVAVGITIATLAIIFR